MGICRYCQGFGSESFERGFPKVFLWGPCFGFGGPGLGWAGLRRLGWAALGAGLGCGVGAGCWLGGLRAGAGWGLGAGAGGLGWVWGCDWHLLVRSRV